jgi:hypothetical protein
MVIVDHLINWVEVIPLSNAAAHYMTKVLLKSITPTFRLTENIDSDNRIHFMATIIKDFTQALGMSCEYHTF